MLSCSNAMATAQGSAFDGASNFHLPLVLLVVFVLGCEPSPMRERGGIPRDKRGEASAAEPEAKAREPATDQAAAQQPADSANEFAFDLYHQLRARDGDVVFGPSNLFTALAMTSAGAAGTTQEEFNRVLHVDASSDRWHESFGARRGTWAEIDAAEELTLKLANRLWARQDTKLLPDFLATTREHYGAECVRLSFARSEEARRAINTWIAEQTEERISELLPRGSISSDTQLVLTSAAYLNGRWAEPFSAEQTQPAPFHVTRTETVRVPMMHQQGVFKYAAAKDGQVLELAFGDGQLAMTILLPAEEKGLKDFEAELNAKRLAEWLEALESDRTVEVYLPRFTTSVQFELASELRSLGMKTAFNAATADFSGMTGGRDLWLSSVIHQAFIAVDEQGSEAAAATAITAEPTGAPVTSSKIAIFRADRPFLYLIRDTQHGDILFLGRLLRPAAASNRP